LFWPFFCKGYHRSIKIASRSMPNKELMSPVRIEKPLRPIAN
jgi:hypothetical protein